MSYSTVANQHSEPFILPNLPYNNSDLSPHMSIETIKYHYEGHHKQYVTNLNNAIFNSKLSKTTLENIILQSNKNPGLTKIFNNAAQIWNHTFFWHSISPKGGGKPNNTLLLKIEEDFKSFDNFLINFKHLAQNHFGSGWFWLILDKKKLSIITTDNANTPITQGHYPIINYDLWEHAYYIDFRNDKNSYIDTFLNHLINWDFAESNYSKFINT